MKISILTPSYNSGKYIERAIQSVLQQDYDNWEHIIVDGGSVDETLEILKKYSHLKWVSEPDRGQSDAMNKAFEMSSGDIIGYLNADDYYEPQIFEYIVNNFRNHPDADIIVGNLYILYCSNGKKGKKILDKPSIAYKKVLHSYKYRFPVNPVSYLYRRHVQGNYRFPIGNHYTMDYDFILSAFQQFQVIKLDRVFGYFIMEVNNKTSTLKDVGKICRRVALAHVIKRDKKLLPEYVWMLLLNRGLRPGLKKVRFRLGKLKQKLL